MSKPPGSPRLSSTGRASCSRVKTRSGPLAVTRSRSTPADDGCSHVVFLSSGDNISVFAWEEGHHRSAASFGARLLSPSCTLGSVVGQGLCKPIANEPWTTRRTCSTARSPRTEEVRAFEENPVQDGTVRHEIVRTSGPRSRRSRAVGRFDSCGAAVETACIWASRRRSMSPDAPTDLNLVLDLTRRRGGADAAYSRAISSLFAPSSRIRRQTARKASASWSRAKTFTAIGPSGIEGVASRS